MEKVFIFDHPLIQHKISLLRDKNTLSSDEPDGTKGFVTTEILVPEITTTEIAAAS